MTKVLPTGLILELRSGIFILAFNPSIPISPSLTISILHVRSPSTKDFPSILQVLTSRELLNFFHSKMAQMQLLSGKKLMNSHFKKSKTMRNLNKSFVFSKIRKILIKKNSIFLKNNFLKIPHKFV